MKKYGLFLYIIFVCLSAYAASNIFQSPIIGKSTMTITGGTTVGSLVSSNGITTTSMNITGALSVGSFSQSNAVISGNVTTGSLEVSGSRFLLPRLTTGQINALTPLTGGHLVFDTSTSTMKIYNSSTWNSVPNFVFGKYGFSTGAIGNTSVPAAGTEVVDYNVKVYDSSNLVTTGATWRLTSPWEGWFQINANCALDSVADAKPVDLRVMKNGALYTAGSRPMASAAETLGANVSATVGMSTGNTIAVFMFNGDASQRAFTSGANYCTISFFGMQQ